MFPASLARSPLNMSNLPLINTAGETGAESATDDALNERLLAALGSGAPQRAERQAQDEARLQQITGQINAQDDLRSGRPQEIGDLQSEAAAGRQFLPFASQLRDVNTQNALDRAQALPELATELLRFATAGGTI